MLVVKRKIMLKNLFELVIVIICSSAKWLLTWIFVLFHGIALLHELRWKGRGFIYLCKPWSFVDRNLASCPLTQSPLPHWPSLEVIHARRLPLVHFSSVAQSCLTLCNPMNCSVPGLPVHHQLLEFTQTHVWYWIGDAIQPSHPLSSPSPPALNLSQHQGLFKWVSSSHQVAKVLEFQLQHQSFQWTPRTDLL